MNIKVVRCCFAGHSDLFGKSEEVTKRIEAVAEELILYRRVESPRPTVLKKNRRHSLLNEEKVGFALQNSICN